MTLRLVAVLGMAILLTGCATRPTARAEAGRLTRTTDQAAILTYTIIAENTSETELPLRMIEYSLEIDGRRVFRGRRSAEATLSRQSRHTIEVPVPVKWEDLPEGASTFRLSGRLGYTLPGIFLEAMFEAGLYRPGVRFELEGTIDPAELRGG